MLTALALGACSSVPLHTPPRASTPAPVTPPKPSQAVNAPEKVDLPPDALLQGKSRWLPVEWQELPGYTGDLLTQWWPAWLRSCDKPAPAFASACQRARSLGQPTEQGIRDFVQAQFKPYRVESIQGETQGLLTGYFEPLLEASRTPRPGFQVAVHMPPSDLGSRKPYFTRQELETLPAGKAALKGREIAYLSDPLDLLLLQIQGSGRVWLQEPSGRKQWVRLAFAGHNDQPFKSSARWLVDQGEITLDQASWPALRAWAKANPRRVNELMWANPRVVFFKEEPLLAKDSEAGPKGAQGVPLTAGRSIAVDRDSIPYGTPVWLDSIQPLTGEPLQRAVMAQDTGSAIVGAVRADYFAGTGEDALALAGRMKQPLRLWVLWPR